MSFSSPSLPASSSSTSSSSSSIMKKVVIVGAGPAGLLLTWNLLGRPGYDIIVLERRGDPRKENPWEDHRSFPMVIQSRGLNAMPSTFQKELSNKGKWMVGFCLHQGKRVRMIPRDRPILSIDRNDMTFIMLQLVASCIPVSGTKLTMYFDATMETISLDDDTNNTITFTIGSRAAAADSSPSAATAATTTIERKTISFDYLIAADGGRSKIRRYLVDTGRLICDEKEVPDDYRTIHFSMDATLNSHNICLDSDKVHSWMLPKHGVRIISSPIHPNTLSGAFVFDKGHDPLRDMTTPLQVQEYFYKLCPFSLGPFMTAQEAQDLLKRPTSTLLSVRCNQLHASNKVVLFGDAAHAVSAALGQGCNSALQDVQIFCHLLDQYKEDWNQVVPAYTSERLKDAHALSDLSDYAIPRSKWMKMELIIRIMLHNVLPKFLREKLLRPMPMQLLADTNLSYSQVLEESKWWIERVKKTHQ